MLKLRLVREPGVLPNERLVIDVNGNCDIGRYCIFASPSLPDRSVDSSVDHAFWLPDKLVEKGDTVVLYTKSGSQRERKSGDNTVHFFYWDLEMPIWGDGKLSPVLLLIEDYSILSLFEGDSDVDGEQ